MDISKSVEEVKPIFRNEKERTELSVFQIVRVDKNEQIEICFAHSSFKKIMSCLISVHKIEFKNDFQDKARLDTLMCAIKKICPVVVQLRNFCFDLNFLTSPDQKIN